MRDPDIEARITVLSDALKSISKNTCCDNCQEAAIVARSALASYVGLARETSQPNRMGTTPEMQKMYDEFGGDDVLRDALGQIAGKNDLSGVPDDDLESAARNALYECELIARAALGATTGGEITDAMLNAAAIEWTRMCHGYPYSNEGVKWSEFFGRMFKAAIAAQPASPLRGREPTDYSVVADFLDDIEVDAKGLCRWSDVADAQVHIRHTLKCLVASPPEQPAADSEDEPGYGGRYGLQRRPNKENK